MLAQEIWTDTGTAGHGENTSSSAVAERPRDASSLSVVSFNSTKCRAQSSIISYTLTFDLPAA